MDKKIYASKTEYSFIYCSKKTRSRVNKARDKFGKIPQRHAVDMLIEAGLKALNWA